MQQPKKEPEKKIGTGASILRFSGLGMQVAVIIGGGAYLGSWLDEKYPMEKRWFTLLGVLVAVVLAMVYAVRTLNRFNR